MNKVSLRGLYIETYFFFKLNKKRGMVWNLRHSFSILEKWITYTFISFKNVKYAPKTLKLKTFLQLLETWKIYVYIVYNQLHSCICALRNVWANKIVWKAKSQAQRLVSSLSSAKEKLPRSSFLSNMQDVWKEQDYNFNKGLWQICLCCCWWS